MDYLRKHWFNLGGILSVVVLAFAGMDHHNLTHYRLLMWLSLVSLLLHQLEEYRIVGTFPGMINTVMFHSNMPDRYPLNTNTALIINVFIGWVAYLLAALAGEKAIWLGMVTIFISAGNTVAHTIVFNIRGKTFYNAGMATCWLFFVPVTCTFFYIIHTQHLVTMTDYFIAVPLGIIVNVVGILKMIDWLKDPNTIYIFPQRSLLPADRKQAKKSKDHPTSPH